MSEDRINANGYTDDADVVLARQATAMDAAQAASLDGELGGSIVGNVTIEGAGIGGVLTTSTLGGAGGTGALTRSGAGHMKRLFDSTTILDQVGANRIEPTADKFEVPFGHVNNITVDLDLTGTVTPALGDVIEVWRRGAPGNQVDIRDDSGGAVICTFPGATINQNGGIFFCKFIFDGAAWRPYHMSMDSSP